MYVAENSFFFVFFCFDLISFEFTSAWSVHYIQENAQIFTVKWINAEDNNILQGGKSCESHQKHASTSWRSKQVFIWFIELILSNFFSLTLIHIPPFVIYWSYIAPISKMVISATSVFLFLLCFTWFSNPSLVFCRLYDVVNKIKAPFWF